MAGSKAHPSSGIRPLRSNTSRGLSISGTWGRGKLRPQAIPVGPSKGQSCSMKTSVAPRISIAWKAAESSHPIAESAHRLFMLLSTSGAAEGSSIRFSLTCGHGIYCEDKMTTAERHTWSELYLMQDLYSAWIRVLLRWLYLEGMSCCPTATVEFESEAKAAEAAADWTRLSEGSWAVQSVERSAVAIHNEAFEAEEAQ